jgi:hypothetical protein
VSIRDFIARISFQNAFSKYIDKKDIKKILNGEIEIEKPKEEECGYIIMDIVQNNNFETTLNDLLNYSKNKNFLHFLSGTIIMFTIYKSKWNIENEINLKEALIDFIKYLQPEILKNLRGIYGIEKAKIGNFGIDYCMHYMVLLKDHIKKILNGGIKIEKPKEEECGYIIMDIMQNNNFETTLNDLLEYSKNKNFLHFLSGTIIMFTIYKSKWNMENEINLKEALINFIKYLQPEILKNLRGIYGMEKAKIGNFGIDYCMHYMVLLKDHIKKIMEIGKIEYGKIIEYKK